VLNRLHGVSCHSIISTFHVVAIARSNDGVGAAAGAQGMTRSGMDECGSSDVELVRERTDVFL
jgi:hypothetical protein